MKHELGAFKLVENEFKVSICIPTLNAAETIEKCLESILNQTVKPYEILIADGYSKDDTLRIVGKNTKVRVIGFAKGIGKARKMLADHAGGDIIAWVDADVVIPSNFLETHLRVHSRNKEIMILSGKWLDGSLTQMACTMKKEVFSIVNYDERFRVGEEWDFMVSAYLKGVRLAYCNDLSVFHARRRLSRKFRLNAIYGGNYVLFLKKYGLWYIRFNPKNFLVFVFSMGMIYALPLSIFLSPFALLVYPAAWLAHSLMYRMLTSPFVLFSETLKGIGEHLYLLKIL